MQEQDKRKFRHELKYVVSTTQLSMLYNRVKNLLPLDAHVKDSGKYTIRSLYFDDYYNSCAAQNENGTDPREKFRIRIYNSSSEHIRLECKRKERGKTYKTSCPLTIEQTKKLMKGEPLRDIANLCPLLKKFTYLMLRYKYKPVVIVE